MQNTTSLIHIFGCFVLNPSGVEYSLVWVMNVMSWIFGGMLIMGAVLAFLQGRTGELTSAILAGGMSAVEMCLELMGTICVWSGIMKIADGAGLCEKLSKQMEPIVNYLFPGLRQESPLAIKSISMNITANVLGLGSAATPSAINAMKEMDRINFTPRTASAHMITLTVLNTASFQLIPTTVAAIRDSAGSKATMDILPAVWLASAVSVAVALVLAKSRREALS